MNAVLVIDDDASWRLKRFEERLENPAVFREDLGRRLANDLREHFRQRQMEGPRNRLGASSSGFWNEIRSSVNDGEVVSDGVQVTISDPRFAQKYFGGTIKADDKLLAIPARTEAYGKSPRLFSNLKAVFFRSGAGALVSEEPGSARAKGEKRIGGKTEKERGRVEGMVFYWLVEEVTQAADPEALPGADAILRGLMDTAEKHAAREIGRIEAMPQRPGGQTAI